MKTGIRNTLIFAIAAVGFIFIGVLISNFLSKSEKRTDLKVEPITQEQVFQTTLTGIRLRDGVPLDLELSIWWRIENVRDFPQRFANPDAYANGVLQPKAHELTRGVADKYPDAGSTFANQRDEFVQELKQTLLQNLGEKGYPIKEVVLLKAEAVTQDYVFQAALKQIRLHDGVPLDLELSVRWKIDDVKGFLGQFPDPDAYANGVLQPKAHEIARKVANTYSDVASVFTDQRDKFVQELKQTLLQNLGEEGVPIKEVILSDITFPANFTRAMEQIAMKEQDLELIRQKNLIDLEGAKAAEKRAKADSQIEMAKAEAAGQVAQIEAQSEEKRRLRLIAKAETEAQILKLNALAEAEQQKVMAQTEVERQTALDEADLEKASKLKDLEIQKQREMAQLQFELEQKLAALYVDNPAYATFLVNKELASKVQIAVLPVNMEAGILGNLLRGTMMPPQAKPKNEK